MKISYICDHCGDSIDTLEVDGIDEAKFGFDCLTNEERQDLIQFDAARNSLQVQSLCDNCIEELGLTDAEYPAFLPRALH
ncbi:MAG: DUF2757 family protein [Negativicutes bacterium]|nr:DUF2757 family protein [Negativicutes bacterium]